MFVVTTTLRGRRFSDAEADSPETALLAGQTMWDDALDENPYQGVERTISTVFMFDGNVIRTIDGRRPQ